eukprot:TRINITY_DN11020_c0_g1_i1.p1 TRINITY_DN11020_c0_g1~~TRINITY_DN11020_c0_g1_i1.p1  ORF type:complete len:504 (+),score=76.30 TRINITY_DN11020_c0_g1_i1:156-1514(+)
MNYRRSLALYTTSLLLLVSVTNGADHSCNCVVFRLDDIQDWYLSNAQRAVIGVFQEEKTPITIGIISKFFGQDNVMVNFIKNILQVTDWDMEIANHGWEHEYFNQYSYEEQKFRLESAVNKTIAMLAPYGVTELPTFIPPMNEWNMDTLRAISETGFKSMSSMSVLDNGGVYPFKNEYDMFRWPIAASTADMANTVNFVPVTKEKTFAQIKAQISQYGYASVMMHPQEFSVPDANGSPTAVLNQTFVDELRFLLDMVREEGIKFTTFRNLPQEFGFSTGSGTTGPRVTTAELTTRSLTTKAVTTKAVSTGAVSTGAVSTGKVTSGLVSTNKVTSGLVSTAKVTSGLVTTNKVTSGLVTSGQVTTGVHGGSPPVGSSSGDVSTSGSATSTGDKCPVGQISCACDANGGCNGDSVCDPTGICVSIGAEDTGSGSSIFSAASSILIATVYFLTIM